MENMVAKKLANAALINLVLATTETKRNAKGKSNTMVGDFAAILGLPPMREGMDVKKVVGCVINDDHLIVYCF